LTRQPSPQLQSLWRQPNASQPVLAVWHMRTGDITLPVRKQTAAALKATIDYSFPRRGVQHVLVTFQKKTLLASFPWLTELGLDDVLDSTVLDDQHAFAMMVNAGVVVTTGSSFGHIPAGLASPGRQLHLYLPPKGTIEMFDGVCCLTDAMSNGWTGIHGCICEPPEQLLRSASQGTAAAHAGHAAQKAGRAVQFGHAAHHTGAGASRGASGQTSAVRGRRLATASVAADSSGGNGSAVVGRCSAATAKSSSSSNRSVHARAHHFVYKLRTHPTWMGSYVRKNTVPVDCAGHIFPEYRYKLRQLAAGIDSEQGAAEGSVAHLAYEGWL
jgi:hypothetical protein